jgi:hypothetical protein
MSKDFDQAIQNVAQHKAAPVAEAKLALAPLRAETEKLAREFDTLAAKLRPALLEAQAKLHRASAVLGCVPQPLQRHLEAAFGTGLLPGILDGAPAGYKDLIQRIDTLSEWDVLQGIPLRLGGTLTGLRGNAGALKALALAVEKDLADLTEALRAATLASPPVLVVERPEPPGRIPVVSEFDLGAPR